MKKVFVVYSQFDNGKPYFIDTNLKAICAKIRKKIKNEELDPEILQKDLWINQYEVDEEVLTSEFKFVLDAYERGEDVYDLVGF